MTTARPGRFSVSSGPRRTITTAGEPIMRAATNVASNSALRRWVVVVLAVGQVVSSAIVFGGGMGDLSSGDSTEATITPAGYAFAIWTVPIVGCLIWALYSLLARRGDSLPYSSPAWPLAAAMTGFSLWLWCAAEIWLWPTVAIFVAMGAALAVAFRRALANPAPTKIGRTLTTGTIGVYIGWTAVAVWANLAAALHDAGDGLANSTAWQAGILVGATATALAGLVAFRGNLVYTGTVLWAFIAVIVATATRDAPTLTALAAAATAIIIFAALAIRRARGPNTA